MHSVCGKLLFVIFGIVWMVFGRLWLDGSMRLRVAVMLCIAYKEGLH